MNGHHPESKGFRNDEPPRNPLVTVEEFASPGALAASFGTQARVYHVGFVVPDLGVWTEDVAAESERLTALGVPPLWWATDEITGRPFFSFYRAALGFDIELVDTVTKPFYPQWFASHDAMVDIADAAQELS